MYQFVSEKSGMSDEASAVAVGRRLKILRLGYGFTQQYMNHFLGYTSPKAQAWNNFETGRTKLTMDGYERLREKFGVPYSWIYHGETDELTAVLRKKINQGMDKIVQARG